jgi:acyl-CoA thioester hydrolase
VARHVCTVPMRWSDVDAYQHANNVAFLDYLQEARVDMLFVHAARRGAERLASGVVVARHVVDYRVPLHPRAEPVRIETWVRRLGHASFTLGYEVVDVSGDGRRTVYLLAETVLVPYDLGGGRPRRLDTVEREALAAHLEGDGPRPQAPPPLPDPPPPVAHVHSCRVRWSDLDAYNHVNNATMLEYFQDARVEMARERVSAVEAHEGSVVARQSIDYRRPLPFRSEPIEVAVSLLRRSAAAYTLGYEVRAEGSVYAQGQSTQVAYDLQRGTARRWSPAERAALDGMGAW